jgi:hypothetical protein
VCNLDVGGMFHGLFENARPTTISGGANSCSDGIYLSAGGEQQTFFAFEGKDLDQLVKRISAVGL